LDLTDEAEGAERYFRLRAPADVPEGFPVYRVEADRGLKGSAAEGGWRPRTFDQPPSPSRLRVEGRAATQPLSHRPPVYSRGPRAAVEPKVYWSREPALPLSLPVPPKGGRVAVQTDGTSLGADAALALVLDGSDSMNSLGKDGRTRFVKAKQALRS